jgi:hypothetical protein
VASPLHDDPPTPVVVDTGASDTRCDAAPIGGVRHTDRVEGAPPVRLELSGGNIPTDALEGFTRVLHDTAIGKPCSSAYVLQLGGDNEVHLYPEKSGGWSGWYRHPANKGVGSTVEPLTCK